MVTAAYAAWMTSSASRLRTELAGLKLSHHQLEEKHRRMKESYTQFIVNPGTRDEAFRKLGAVLAEGEADIINKSGPSTTSRMNYASGIAIK